MFSPIGKVDEKAEPIQSNSDKFQHVPNTILISSVKNVLGRQVSRIAVNYPVKIQKKQNLKISHVREENLETVQFLINFQ